jgi:hypothetical protein
MKTRIKNDSTMSNTTYNRRCTPGQQNWWLKDENGEFIELGSHRGDKDIDVTLDLEPGTYTLGCGPGKNGGRRQ